MESSNGDTDVQKDSDGDTDVMETLLEMQLYGMTLMGKQM